MAGLRRPGGAFGQLEYLSPPVRSVSWRCGSCDEVIIDRGLCDSPAEDERGHTRSCPRLAATIAAWDAEWEALDADWEAGQ
jgi:hypothetical protein